MKFLKKSSIWNRIAMVISIIIFIIAVLNLFFNSEPLRFMVWGLCIIVMTINCLKALSDNFKQLGINLLLFSDVIRWKNAFQEMEDYISLLDIPEKEKSMILETMSKTFVENCNESNTIGDELKYKS